MAPSPQFKTAPPPERELRPSSPPSSRITSRPASAPFPSTSTRQARRACAFAFAFFCERLPPKPTLKSHKGEVLGVKVAEPGSERLHGSSLRCNRTFDGRRSHGRL